MNAQATLLSAKTPAPLPTLAVAPGRALSLPAGAGELRVLRGRLWLTGHGQGPAGADDDRVLAAGERLRLGHGHAAVLESWDRGENAVVQWVPRSALWLGAVYRFLARARSAASTASRSQGCIAAGDSIASCGALK